MNDSNLRTYNVHGRNYDLQRGSLQPFGNYPNVFKGKIYHGNDSLNILLKITDEHEGKFFTIVRDNILNKHLSPNFLPILKIAKCGSTDIKPYLARQKKPVKISKNVTVIVWYVPTELTGLQFNSLNEEDMKTCLFQIIYTLELLNRLQLNHNNLVPENILILRNSSPISQTFMIKSDQGKYVPFVMSTRIIPVLMNPVFGSDGQPSEQFFNPYRDLYTLLCSLDFISPLGQRYNFPTIRHKEGGVPVASLTSEQNELLHISSKKYDKKSRYCSGSTFKEFLNTIPEDKRINIGNIINPIFYTVKSGQEYLLYLYNPKKCELYSSDRNIPLPIQMIGAPLFQSLIASPQNNNIYYLFDGVYETDGEKLFNLPSNVNPTDNSENKHDIDSLSKEMINAGLIDDEDILAELAQLPDEDVDEQWAARALQELETEEIETV
jgi:serine/threonine protein kinase